MPTKERVKRLRQQKHRRLLRACERIANCEDQLEALLAGVDDSWEPIRQKVIELAADRGEWAGYPLPIEHAKLVIEPTHPLFKTLNGATTGDSEPIDNDGATIINTWPDYSRGRQVLIWREADGRILGGVAPLNNRFTMAMGTQGASQAWSVRAEFTALARLKTLVTVAAFRYYLLTGTFLETSKRSGVTYMFRKLRPTLAIRADDSGSRLLAALCGHPIGYYENTFAGSMVPTDDVISHLVFMRGDEHGFWKKSNQHRPLAPEAGV